MSWSGRLTSRKKDYKRNERNTLYPTEDEGNGDLTGMGIYGNGAITTTLWKYWYRDGVPGREHNQD